MDIQYSLTGVPKNVPRREYSRYTLVRALAGFVLPFLGIGSLFVALSGLTLRRAAELEALPELRLGPETPAPGRYRVTGRLDSPAPIAMSDSGEKVLRGELSLILEGRIDNKRGRRVIIDWSEAAESFELAQGDRRLPLRLDPAALPMVEDKSSRVDMRFENPSSRNKGKLLELRYRDRSIPVSPEAWTTARDPRARLRRATCPRGTLVTFAARLDENAVLMGDAGPVRRFELGDLAAVRSRGEAARPVLAVFGVLALLGAAACRPWIKRTRADFARRSNAA